jgi:hypothetical protein
MFTNVRYWNLDYGIDAGLFAVPRLIDGAVSPKNSMTLLSWYRQNFMEYFMPSSLNMSELQSRFSLIRRQLDAKPEMVNFGNGVNTSATKAGEQKKQTQKGGTPKRRKRRLKVAAFSRMRRVEEMKESEF